MVNKVILIIPAFFLIVSCNSSPNKKTQYQQNSPTDTAKTDTTITDTNTAQLIVIEDTTFVDIKTILEDIDLNFVYADTTNFFKVAVYPCEQCLLRYEVAIALEAVSMYLETIGYKLQLLDCYRPFSVQEFMWSILPDSRYVANPSRGGSIHNRGGAIDLRLLYPNNDTVPMGTKFDHFGIEAAHSYTKLPDSVIANRKTLKEAMEKYGFIALNTEWWHYSYKNAKSYPVASVSFNCNE